MRPLYRILIAFGAFVALALGLSTAACATPAPSGSASPSASPAPSLSVKPSVKPSTSASSSPKCDTVHYRTAGKDCVPAAEKKFDCKSLHYQVHIVVIGEDPRGLDKDEDGIGCESNFPWPTPTAAPSTSSAPAALAVTGFNAWGGLAAGSALVLVGGTAIAISRRRRNRFVA